MFDGKLDQDLGGNRWLVNMPWGQATNAHAMWDSVAFAWGNDKQGMIVFPEPRPNLTLGHQSKTGDPTNRHRWICQCPAHPLSHVDTRRV